jgi:hypothetical protein
MAKITRRMIREWFVLRFSKLPEEDRTYFAEWVGRFEKGPDWAWDRMDSDSRACWTRVWNKQFKKGMK